MLFIFVIGYLGIAFEHVIKVNKTAIALLTGVALWTIHFLANNLSATEDIEQFKHHFSDISELIFFLLGSMAIVELIDAHQGFKIITDTITTRSKMKMLWLTSILCFFLSAVLDNLTTTIVMVSLMRKLIEKQEDRWIFGAAIVISANAGGSWTPIGDVTTTMLWMEGMITSIQVMKSLFIPAVISLIVSLIYQSFFLKGEFAPRNKSTISKALEPRAKIILGLGIASLIFVPIFKSITHLPIFVGTLLGVGFLWMITDLLHHKHEERAHLRLPHVFGKIDISGVLFFLGILLAVAALDTTGLLKKLSILLDTYIASPNMIALLIGVISAIIDNVPLVAATMSMYSLEQFPVDSPFWELVAYCAGTGGSILIIGSAAGVAYMGMEKVPFFWYLRKVTPVALIGYLAGAGAYIAINAFM
jgi:NhaD family Na+/H+ antiporter